MSAASRRSVSGFAPCASFEVHLVHVQRVDAGEDDRVVAVDHAREVRSGLLGKRKERADEGGVLGERLRWVAVGDRVAEPDPGVVLVRERCR